MDLPEPSMTFTKEQAEEAVALADFAVVREAMGRTNPHDLNNIRGQIHIATRLEKKGEPGFRQFLHMAMQSNVDPLVAKGLGVIAQKLHIPLNEEEREYIEGASTQLSFLKLTARQQPEDVHTDMRALQRRLTPPSIYDYRFNYPTLHNPDHYYETMLGKGVPDDQAADEAALLQLTLYRIGLTLKRFNPNFNNPVEFVDIAVDRVINHNHHKKRSSMQSRMCDYLKGWAQEVKADYLGAKDPKQVQQILSDVTLDLLMPGRSNKTTTTPRSFSTQTQMIRNFRDSGDDLPQGLRRSTVTDVCAAVTLLGNAFSERHDVTRFFDTYLHGPAYETMSLDKRRAIKGVIDETCHRLGVAKPGQLADQNAPALRWQERIEAKAREMRGPRNLH